MTKTYHIITFGCQMNKNDSEHIAGMLTFEGYKFTPQPEKADLLIFNTCAVREKSERRVYGQLDKYNYLRKKNQFKQKLMLAGCMPAYNKENIVKRVSYLDGFIDIDEARRYPAIRENCHQAWVAITSGCNNFCSYCIVPYTRGREKSRPSEEIIDEIKKIDFTLHNTLYLLGQNVNSYYCGTVDFPGLLEKTILEIPAIPKLNFLTSHPKDMSDRLIELIAKYPKIDREIHFPLQAGNNRILQLMNRKYSYEHYKSLVEKLRQKVPDVKISTDLIVGFPGESEAEFEDTLQAVRELKFSRVNTAAYSIRPATASASMPGQLSTEVKNQRLQKLMEHVDKFCIKS